MPNLFRAWNEFKCGKIKKQDVAEFSVDIAKHIFDLHKKLRAGTYVHSAYKAFYIYDPKRRHIHKAQVIDRLLHHAIFRVLYPIFDKKFIYDSYSSRERKGTHKAHVRFRKFAWKLSQNNTKKVWVLKCDIKRFFDSVDHETLLKILSHTIHDEKALWLLRKIIQSFEVTPGKGIPLGNLTSQLFSNVYLDVFDQYIKRDLKIKHYIRYADDFVILDNDKQNLLDVLPSLNSFLSKELKLALHPNKVILRKFSQGVDFLGYVIFPFHQILRTNTKKRILKKIRILKIGFERKEISEESLSQSLASYDGILQHCRGKGIGKSIDGILEK